MYVKSFTCMQHNFVISERTANEAESSYSLDACEQVGHPQLRMQVVLCTRFEQCKRKSLRCETPQPFNIQS